jgi:tyrosine-protein kinase Etk/Wzc
MALKNFQTDRQVSLADFWHTCKKAKKTIALYAFFFAALAIVYRLTSPVEFQATATFREKGKAASGSSGITALLLNNAGGGDYSESMTAMSSQTLLEQIAQNLGLQAPLSRDEAQYPLLRAIRDNIKVEWALWQRRPGPLLAEQQLPITVQNVVYNGELPLQLKLRFITEDTYQVSSSKVRLLGTGRLGTIFSTKEAGFNIIRKTLQPLLGQEFLINLQPMATVVKSIAAKLKIKTDVDDRGLLNLSFDSTNRHLAADVLNSLMFRYQDYLKEEQTRLLNEQVDYLQTRHEQIRDHLIGMMEEHAASLSKDVMATGYIDVGRTMDFLSNTLQQYTQKLLTIDLELKRLDQMSAEGRTYYDRYSSEQEGAGSVINTFVSQIRALKQQGDSLELALHTEWADQAHRQEGEQRMATQLTELAEIQHLSQQTHTLLTSLKQGTAPDLSLPIVRDSRYRIQTWLDALAHASPKEALQKERIQQFIGYLSNLIHLFNVHEHVIQERLTHQQNPQIAFKVLTSRQQKSCTSPTAGSCII